MRRDGTSADLGVRRGDSGMENEVGAAVMSDDQIRSRTEWPVSKVASVHFH
jgi:hypothetical protein